VIHRWPVPADLPFSDAPENNHFDPDDRTQLHVKEIFRCIANSPRGKPASNRSVDAPTSLRSPLESATTRIAPYASIATWLKVGTSFPDRVLVRHQDTAG